MEWDNIVRAIETVIQDIRKDYVIDNKIIRDDIFRILETYCTVLYYPIEEEKNCGFHVKKIVKEQLEDFVYINTSKPLEEQIFAAAHELGHIWNVGAKVWKFVGGTENLCRELEENITNRFAAELLMPSEMFRVTFYKHMEEMGVSPAGLRLGDLIRIISAQMSEFLVPYESVRKRLYETKIIGENTRELLKKNREIILPIVEAYSKEQMSRLGLKEEKSKTIPGLRALLEKAESSRSLDIYTIKKIKSDFGICSIDTKSDILKIQLGENQNGEEGSAS